MDVDVDINKLADILTNASEYMDSKEEFVEKVVTNKIADEKLSKVIWEEWVKLDPRIVLTHPKFTEVWLMAILESMNVMHTYTPSESLNRLNLPGKVALKEFEQPSPVPPIDYRSATFNDLDGFEDSGGPDLELQDPGEEYPADDPMAEDPMAEDPMAEDPMGGQGEAQEQISFLLDSLEYIKATGDMNQIDKMLYSINKLQRIM